MNLLCLLGIPTTNLSLNPKSLILDIPGFAKDVIRDMVDWVWKTARCGTDKVVPLLLPPHPSQYCFPEPEDIRMNLDSSFDGSGNGLLVMKRQLQIIA